jgi:hypothetical protein
VMAPVAAMPPTVPVAAMPPTVPVTAMPVAVVMVVPVHFFRLDAIDFVLRDDGGLDASRRRRGPQFIQHRRQRCGLRSCGKRSAARHKTHRNL